MSANNYPVLWSRDAHQDLLTIWHFGAQEWSPDMADRHLRDIEDMCERLRDDPKLGRTRDDLIPGIRSLLVRPHVVFYQISPTAIRIVRILHQRFDTDTLFRP
jgi:toxin ParE1/3/4